MTANSTFPEDADFPAGNPPAAVGHEASESSAGILDGREAMKDPEDAETWQEVSRPLVIYHARCSDGFAAAFAAWLFYRDGAEYLPLVHSDVVPDVSGRLVYMLDIAFSLETMERVAASAQRLTVLDHHKTAAQELACFHCRNGKVLFNMEKSAARLAWEHFHPQEPMPSMLSHVEDRDLLRWALTDSETYLASLDYGPHNFHRWAGVMNMREAARARFMERGALVRNHTRMLAEDLAREARSVEVLGRNGLMVAAPDLMHNLVGELLLKQGVPFALMWCLEGKGARVKVGLRGAPGFDTSELSESFGGGGHPFSSAFRLPLERLGELVQGKLS